MSDHNPHSSALQRRDGRITPLDAAEKLAQQREKLAQQRQALWLQEFVVETNAGTYSDGDALRAVGTSDPVHAEYRIYERVGDARRRVEGCNPKSAPGTPRRMSRGLVAARARLRAML